MKFENYDIFFVYLLFVKIYLFGQNLGPVF